MLLYGFSIFQFRNALLISFVNISRLESNVECYSCALVLFSESLDDRTRYNMHAILVSPRDRDTREINSVRSKYNEYRESRRAGLDEAAGRWRGQRWLQNLQRDTGLGYYSMRSCCSGVKITDERKHSWSNEDNKDIMPPLNTPPVASPRTFLRGKRARPSGTRFLFGRRGMSGGERKK